MSWSYESAFWWIKYESKNKAIIYSYTNEEALHKFHWICASKMGFLLSFSNNQSLSYSANYGDSAKGKSWCISWVSEHRIRKENETNYKRISAKIPGFKCEIIQRCGTISPRAQIWVYSRWKRWIHPISLWHRPWRTLTARQKPQKYRQQWLDSWKQEFCKGYFQYVSLFQIY